MKLQEGLERAKGIEPSYAAWEAAVLPLNYARLISKGNQGLGEGVSLLTEGQFGADLVAGRLRPHHNVWRDGIKHGGNGREQRTALIGHCEAFGLWCRPHLLQQDAAAVLHRSPSNFFAQSNEVVTRFSHRRERSKSELTRRNAGDSDSIDSIASTT